MKVDSWSQLVRSLQEVLHESGATASPEAVQERALALRFPDPALASEVARFLQQKTDAARWSDGDVSDALAALLLVEGGTSKAGRLEDVRRGLRAHGERFGTSLAEVHAVAVRTGFGISPSLLDLVDELRALLSATSAEGPKRLLDARVREGTMEPWRASLFVRVTSRAGRKVSFEDVVDAFAQTAPKDAPLSAPASVLLQSRGVHANRALWRALAEYAEAA